MLFVLYHCIPTLHHKNCTVMKLPPEYFLRTDLYHVEVCVCSPTSLTCVRYCLWSAIQQASYFCVRICHLLCRLSVFTLSMFHAEFVPFQWLVQRLVNICQRNPALYIRTQGMRISTYLVICWPVALLNKENFSNSNHLKITGMLLIRTWIKNG